MSVFSIYYLFFSKNSVILSQNMRYSECCTACFHLHFALQINCVMVPMGQYTHQLRGLNSTIVTNPNTVDVSITL